MSTTMSSLQWLALTDLLCVVGIGAAALAAFAHARQAMGAAHWAGTAAWAGRVTIVALWAAMLSTLLSIVQRGIEVNHFPCQTMGEVLTVFSLAVLVSMIALHYALGLRRRSAGWAVLDDAIVLLVFLVAPCTHWYVRSLSTAQRDLPPALQSYWFPPHISALIFSYATLSIAGLICVVYFCTRFWTGVFRGGVPRKKQVLTALALIVLPFVQVVTIPVFVLSGLVFWWLARTQRLPQLATLGALEKELDEVSFRAFSVGMPFLTAGVFMGAFWAQEAWANYWGWDSKENSALITWLVYVVYIHLRMLGGYRGEKAMALLTAGTLSIFITFQLFGYLPDSQKSLHRYTEDNVVPREGMQGPKATTEAKADNAERAEEGAARGG